MFIWYLLVQKKKGKQEKKSYSVVHHYSIFFVKHHNDNHIMWTYIQYGRCTINTVHTLCTSLLVTGNQLCYIHEESTCVFLQGLREIRLCLTLHNDYRSSGVCHPEFSLRAFISFHIKCSISHQPIVDFSFIHFLEFFK